MFRQQLELVCAQPMSLRTRPPVVIPPHCSYRTDAATKIKASVQKNAKINKTDLMIVSRFRVFSFGHFPGATLDLSPNIRKAGRAAFSVPWHYPMIFRPLAGPCLGHFRLARALPPKHLAVCFFFVPGAIGFFPPSAPQTRGGKVQMKQSRTPSYLCLHSRPCPWISVSVVCLLG